MNDPRIGSTLGGYRIEALIGRGGMGVVYRAEDLRLGRKVALKLLAPDLAGNERFRERFESESRLAAAIDHPHIIPLYESKDVDGLLFLTMRYVDGIDLKALLDREGALPVERALGIAAQIGGALDAAHARGLVHRDVKPANVLVDRARDPEARDHYYLTDFGLTKDTSQGKPLTATGHFVGTIDYVAPEQIDGHVQGPATDQYALGCMLYECLTGQPPYRRDNELAVMWAHLADTPPTLAPHRTDLPGALDAVLARALAKAPEDRYPTCTAMVAAARAAAARGTAVSRVIAVAPAAEPAPAEPEREPMGSPGPSPAGVTRPSPPPVPPQPASEPAGAHRTQAPAHPPLAVAQPTRRPAAEAAPTKRPPADAAPASAPPADAPPADAPPAGAPPARPRPRLVPVVAAIAVLLAAAVAGVVVARGGDGGSDAAAAGRSVPIAGGLSLRVASDWEPLASRPEIPGVALADSIAIGPRAARGREGILAGRMTVAAMRALRTRLAPASGAAGAARDGVRLGAADAFRYRSLRPSGYDGLVTAYVVLAEAGPAAIVCFAAAGRSTSAFMTRCADVAATLQLTGTTALALAPSPQYARELSRLVQRVGRARTRGQSRLGAAKTSKAQGAIAATLASSWAEFARAARGLQPPPAVVAVNDAVAVALDRIGVAYASAARAARSHDRAGYGLASRLLRSCEDELRTAAGDLAEMGYTTRG